MAYALIIAGAVESVGRLPNSARRLDNGNWVMGLATASDALKAACGYRAVIDNVPTYDPATQVLERGDVFLADPTTPVRAYTIIPKTAEQIAAELAAATLAATVAANTETLTDQLSVEARITSIKAFLVDADVQVALDQPNATALTASQQNRFNKAVARQLRRQANAWIATTRLACGQHEPALLADISDTSGEV
jgi:hypothetical protein